MQRFKSSGGLSILDLPLEFGIWILGLCTWTLDHGILDLGIWILELGTWNLSLCRPVAPRLVAPHEIEAVFGIWILEFGSWYLDLGIWNLGLN